MATILTGRDRIFASWAAKRIPHIGTEDQFGKYVAVGVATGQSADDKLMAVVIFHDYHPQYGHCQISVAAANPKWVSRQTIRALLAIPFMQYRCQKCWVAIPHNRPRVIGLGKALGFTQEATLKNHFGRGTHAAIMRMLDAEYNRMYWPQNAKAA